MASLSARTCSVRGTPFGAAQRVPQPVRFVVAMAKPGIHPEWHSEAKVICNGVEVMKVGGTKPQYNVDIYSGNHPFYQGNKNFLVVDEGQLNKFKKRFAELDLQVADLSKAGPAGMVKPDPSTIKAKSTKGKGKK